MCICYYFPFFILSLSKELNIKIGLHKSHILLVVFCRRVRNLVCLSQIEGVIDGRRVGLRETGSNNKLGKMHNEDLHNM
jgi:hypothetical protein